MAASDVLPVVVIDYEELLAAETSPALRAKIVAGYGYDGLGIVAVRGVPDFGEARAACLPHAYRFGNLPAEVKAKYEHPASFYSFGWSHGKEKLEGKPDTAKGSFYFNPIHDRPFDDPAVIAAHPPFCHPNIWPEEGDAPGFAEACKRCAGVIVRVGGQLARHCDAYVRSEDPSYGEHGLEKFVTTARTHKARLLYYFPMESAPAAAAEGAGEGAAAAAAAGASPVAPAAREVASDSDTSSWCGWHNDHGSLTGLAPAMYWDASGREIKCPDPLAGLYVRTRTGKSVRVVVPPDCIAYQMGETAQVHTGGWLQATPHCVRAAEVRGVSRGTLAVFMEPEWTEKMAAPPRADTERVLRGARGELLPRGVPPLVSRWDVSGAQDFGGFSDKTLSMYY